MKVLANLLEEQGLFKEAYIEEIKDSVSKFPKVLKHQLALHHC
jgi:hypothetical protein